VFRAASDGPRGEHGQRQADVSTKHAAPPKGARLSGADGKQKRPPRPEAPARQRAQAADCQQRIEGRLAGFSRNEHIRRRADFQQVYQRGTKVHGRYCTLFVLPNQLPVGRLGIAATKKLGGAVERNRAKRLIREVFRRNKIAIGLDLVVVPKRELLDASLTAIEADYRNNVRRAGAATRL
jgi:ribonuclease P protein component